MSFGRIIRREREAQGTTLCDLARRVGISVAYLSRIERERENPPPAQLVCGLAGALGLPQDELFAAARRLSPDLRQRVEEVIAAHRRQAHGRS